MPNSISSKAGVQVVLFKIQLNIIIFKIIQKFRSYCIVFLLYLFFQILIKKIK